MSGVWVECGVLRDLVARLLRLRRCVQRVRLRVNGLKRGACSLASEYGR